MKSNMFVRFFFLFFTLIYASQSFANASLYYIDMDRLLNNSLAGKSIIKQLANLNEKNVTIFKKTEESLKKDENKIVSQKNILDKNEFDNEIKIFKKKVSDYKLKRSDLIKNINKKKINAQSELIKKLTPILEEYSKKNSISYIISKKNIIIAQKQYDLTDVVLKILDSKVKNIKLK
jgi:Skp family chaperone for outer membrane proteins